MTEHNCTELAEIMMNDKKEPQYIVCVGPLFEQQTFYGPFENFDEASEWADNNVVEFNWIVTLHPPY